MRRRGGAAALGPRSGNVRDGGASAGEQTVARAQQRKGNKRKQADSSDQHGGAENEPPQKKPLARVSVKMPGKRAGGKAASKKKLIAGQGTLTGFFRV